MTSTTPGGRLRRLSYRVFYTLPPRWRRVLVRMGSQKYIVGSVVLLRDSSAPGAGRILLLRQPPGNGWGLPAGLMNRGESPVAAAARELLEESGVRLEVDQLTPAVPCAVLHVRGRWVDMVYEAAVPAEEVSLAVDGAEVLEAQWHRLDSLPPLTLASARLLANYGIGPYAEYPEARV